LWQEIRNFFWKVGKGCGSEEGDEWVEEEGEEKGEGEEWEGEVRA